MKHIAASACRVMPWKNGGGTTAEIYVAGRDPSAFDWRVSIAAVAGDGPFSRFAGYDRHIMTIEGSGMVLEGGPEGPIVVAPAFTPCRFSGDWQITARLIDGPSRDFNLMARSDSHQSGLSVQMPSGPEDYAAGDGWLLIHVLAGELSSEGGTTLRQGDSVILEPGEGLRLSPRDDARLALCRVVPRGRQ